MSHTCSRQTAHNAGRTVSHIHLQQKHIASRSLHRGTDACHVAYCSNRSCCAALPVRSYGETWVLQGGLLDEPRPHNGTMVVWQVTKAWDMWCDQPRLASMPGTPPPLFPHPPLSQLPSRNSAHSKLDHTPFNQPALYPSRSAAGKVQPLLAELHSSAGLHRPAGHM